MKLKEKITGNLFIKNLMIYLGSNVIAQAVGILVSPILTRLFSPDAYGIQSVFMALISSLSIVSTLSYQNAIPISDEKEETNLVSLSFLVLLLSTFAVFSILTLQGGLFLSLFQYQELTPYKYFIPAGLLCIGFYNILLQYSIKYKSFSVISHTKITQSVVGNLGKILFGFLNLDAFGLILGNIIGQSLGVHSLLNEYIRRRKDKNITTGFHGIKKVFLRYRKFAYFSTPCNCIYVFGSQFPVLMLSSLYGSEISGYYSLANTVVNIPCNLIGMALSQVFYSELAERRTDEHILKAIHSLLAKTVLIGLIPFLLLILLAPRLFVFVYGKEWIMAGKFASAMAVQVFFYFIILPVSKVFEIFEKQQYDLVFNCVRLAILFVIFIAAGNMGLTAYQTILVYALSGSMLYIFLLAAMEYMLRAQFSNPTPVK